METFILQMDSQGRVVLPKEIRGKSKKKKYYTCQIERDGTVHLVPVVGVLTSKQAYFWTPQWQKAEKAVSQDLESGHYDVVSPQQLGDYLATL